MANKKCPKCGEDNPAEAVMCWACYTPLTASAGAAMGAGAGLGGAGTATLPRPGTAVGVPGAEVAEKKEIDPKLFFVGGGLILAGVIALFTTGVLGGGSSEPLPPAPVESSGFDSTRAPGLQPVQEPVVSRPVGQTGSTDTGRPPEPPPVTEQWNLIVTPNPRYTTATFAIASAQPNVSPSQALNLARMARKQMASNGRWTKMQIAVYSSTEGGQAFRQYMNQRKGAPLAGGDFAALAGQGAWNGALVFYETAGKSEKPSYPSKNPTGWWGR